MIITLLCFVQINIAHAPCITSRRVREYKVVIKFAARANLHHLGQFLAGKRADAPQEALQILDIVLRELSNKR